MTKSGKSAKSYRLERDAALAQLNLHTVEALRTYLSQRQIDEDTAKQILDQSKDATNATIFKATDLLIQQNRLIKARLFDDKYTLEFRL